MSSKQTFKRTRPLPISNALLDEDKTAAGIPDAIRALVKLMPVAVGPIESNAVTVSLP